MVKIGIAIAALAVIIVLSVFSFNQTPFNALNLLKKESTVTINNKLFKVELADNPAERMQGLSERQSLAEDMGMLFLFEKPDLYTFWMKGMKFPLDIVFISGDKIVTVIDNLQPASTEGQLHSVFPENPVDKVLEINAGLAQKYNLKKGDSVQLSL